MIFSYGHAYAIRHKNTNTYMMCHADVWGAPGGLLYTATMKKLRHGYTHRSFEKITNSDGKISQLPMLFQSKEKAENALTIYCRGPVRFYDAAGAPMSYSGITQRGKIKSGFGSHHTWKIDTTQSRNIKEYEVVVFKVQTQQKEDDDAPNYELLQSA